jgi:hypothetical protein
LYSRDYLAVRQASATIRREWQHLADQIGGPTD